MNQAFDESAVLDSTATSLPRSDAGGQPFAGQAGSTQEARLDTLINRLLELETMLAAAGKGSPAGGSSCADADVDTDAMQALLKSVGKLQIERDRARANLDQRFDEIVTLTRLLEEARSRNDDGVKTIAALKRELAAAKAKGDRVRHAEERVRRSLLIQVELVKRLQKAAAQTPLQTLGQSWRRLRAALASDAKRRRAILSLGKSFDGGVEELARYADLLRDSVLFDAEWYLVRYPDVAESKALPELHYLKFGAAEHRDPSPLFSTKRYLDLYPDVAKSRLNPLVHYITHGLKERRIIEPAQVK